MNSTERLLTAIRMMASWRAAVPRRRCAKSVNAAVEDARPPNNAAKLRIVGLLAILVTVVLTGFAAHAADAQSAATQPQDPGFTPPERGFISKRPAIRWEHALVTGNGTMGALVMGNPFDDTLYLSHAALYLPRRDNDNPVAMAKHLGHIRELCLAGKFKEAGAINDQIRHENNVWFGRDTFIGAFSLRIKQPETDITRYQRAVDFMTGEASVTFSGEGGTVRRSTFVSRADDVIVVRIAGSGKQAAMLSFEGFPAHDIWEIKEIANSVTGAEKGRKDQYLYFSTTFQTNLCNSLRGYEGLGRIVVPKGNWVFPHGGGFKVPEAKEILVLIKIRPLLKTDGGASAVPELTKALEALPADYDALLARHAKIHGALMGRVSLSLNAPAADRAKPTEDLLRECKTMVAPLAQIERCFDAGRYNIISSSGLNPPNLQGLWAATWLAPWAGSFTIDGNVPTAIAFLGMGNTPELMEPFFRLHERFLPDYRRNTRELYGMRGFHIPAQMTTSGRITDFQSGYALAYWHGGAPWMCQFFYDHWQYTGDRKFLAERAYPFMKEAAEFYEDFLTVTDDKGRLVFVPSYSPENGPGGENNPHTCINATMDVASTKQLLRNCIAAAKELGCDEELRKKWAGIIAKLPPYEVAEDGSFREWLWPGLKDYNAHRHASNFYPLYDEMPKEIISNPALVKAVGYSGRGRMDYGEKSPMAPFGMVLTGLAGAHVGDAELAQRAINALQRYWSHGMMSYLCCFDDVEMFGTDISGGFPYLCASTLVYSDPGLIRFFPARPPQWTSGSVKGLRLRGAITLKELTWDGQGAKAVLVSDKDQKVTLEVPGREPRQCALGAGKSTEVTL